MAKIEVDMHQLVADLPEEQREAALAALLSCNIEQVYLFLRSAVSSPARMMLDLGWRQIQAEQKLFLNALLTKCVEQDFESAVSSGSAWE